MKGCMRVKKRLVLILNILTVIAMLIHVTAAYRIHSAHPEWSAPAYLEFLNAVFYLVPLLLFDLICLLISRHTRRQNAGGRISTAKN